MFIIIMHFIMYNIIFKDPIHKMEKSRFIVLSIYILIVDGLAMPKLLKP